MKFNEECSLQDIINSLTIDIPKATIEVNNTNILQAVDNIRSYLKIIRSEVKEREDRHYIIYINRFSNILVMVRYNSKEEAILDNGGLLVKQY